MLRAIYSSLLASLAPLEQIRNQGTDARGIRKKDHRRHSESCFCTSERNKPCPLSSLKLFFTKPPRICQDSRARPGCRKRKCRSVDVVSHLAACVTLPNCFALPCARCEVRRSLFRRDVSSRSAPASAPRKRLASIAICGHLTRPESCYRIWVSLVCHD
jgi:hypothetical protein